MSVDPKPVWRGRLFEVAQRVGLPIEAVNSASDFFLRRVPGWQEELRLLKRGKKGKIFRPSPTLFVFLKLCRGTEADVADCRTVLKKGARLEKRKFERWVDELGVEMNERSKDFVKKCGVNVNKTQR